MSICASIVGIIDEQAHRQAFSHVRRVRLEIGPLAGVEIESLKFGFDVVARNSVAEGAALDIIETEARALCRQCGWEGGIVNRFDPCPDCGAHGLRITCGDELRIKELEVD